MGDRRGDFTKGTGGPPLVSEKLDIFYEAPPGLVKEKEQDRPEDLVPDLPGNEPVRDFLASAPSKGLWHAPLLALGISRPILATWDNLSFTPYPTTRREVKCMQCWRCKQFGHRTGDRECPLREGGNPKSEAERQARMDPMYHLMQQGKQSEEATKTSSTKGHSLKELAKQLVELQKEKKRKKKEKREKRKREKDHKKDKKDKKDKGDRQHHKKRRRSHSTTSG